MLIGSSCNSPDFVKVRQSGNDTRKGGTLSDISSVLEQQNRMVNDWIQKHGLGEKGLKGRSYFSNVVE